MQHLADVVICKKLIYQKVLPKNVTTIEQNAFENTALTSITILQSVITIEPYAIGYTYGYNEESGVVGSAEVKDFTIYGYKSTVLTFSSVYLDIFSVGVHKVKLKYTDSLTKFSQTLATVTKIM